ncbi:MAG: septum formation family protein [Chloroflexi bacterium]|nr:septum formation family protein [Chloroflexota bacterium]
MRGLLLRVGVIAVIVVGGLILRDRLSGSAGDLRVGDCFDQPVAAQNVDDVQHHPCTDPHTAEIIFVGDHPDQDAYPSLNSFDSFVLDRCVPAFESYTGRDWATDTELDMAYFYPTSEGWPEGDHEVSCYVVRIDSGTMNASVKAPN